MHSTDAVSVAGSYTDAFFMFWRRLLRSDGVFFAAGRSGARLRGALARVSEWQDGAKFSKVNALRRKVLKFGLDIYNVLC